MGAKKRNGAETNHKKKRRRVEVEEDEEDFTKYAEDIVKNLLAKTCKINFVSPIEVVAFNPNFLSKLKKLVLLALSDNLSVHLDRHWIYDVNFQIVRGIKNAEKDSESLYFSVLRRDSTVVDENDSDDEDEMVGFSRVFHGLFSSRGSTGRGMRYYTRDEYQYLPLLLYSGYQAVWKAIEGTLKNALNCFIVPLEDVPTSAIKDFTGRWLMVNQLDNTISEKDTMKMSISYPSKTSFSFSQEVTFYIAQFEDIITKYRRLDEVTTQNVHHLWENLLSRLSCISRFNLHKFDISKVALKNFEISNGGTVRAKYPSVTCVQDLLSSLTRYAECSSSQR